MKVVFLTFTPLAGAPIRIADALNAYTGCSTRVIDVFPRCYGARTFPEDLLWKRDRAECLDLLASADVVQTFHWIDYNSTENPLGLALARIVKPACKFVRMYESDVQFVAKWIPRLSVKDILSDTTPRMVIPHYPERSFRDAYVAPNIIPIRDPLLSPPTDVDGTSKVNVFYSASSKTSMWEQRWNTKGAPEVLKALNRARREVAFNINYVTDTPYAKCMEMKRRSDIVIGDTTSGSFHLTDLEALSQGRPTFTYADPRSIQVLMALLGCPELPFVNARIEELQAPLVELVKDSGLRREIGDYSRQWIEKWYRDDKLVDFYVRAYERLLDGEDLKRQDCLEFPRAKTFLYNDIYDLQWETRKRNPLIRQRQGGGVAVRNAAKEVGKAMMGLKGKICRAYDGFRERRMAKLNDACEKAMWVDTDIYKSRNLFMKRFRTSGDLFWLCAYCIALHEAGRIDELERLLSARIGDGEFVKAAAHFLPLAAALKRLGCNDAEVLRGADVFARLKDNHARHLFKTFLKGKSVAIVGNGPGEIGKSLGGEIDAHDVVIRINNHRLDGYEADYGTRTDVWAKAFSNNINHAIDPSEGCRLVVYATNWMRHQLSPGYLSAVENDLKRYAVDFTDRFDRAWMTDRLHANPTTGAVLIEMVRHSDVRSLDVYGFSFIFDDDGPYRHFNNDLDVNTLAKESSSHRLDVEKAVLRRLLTGERGIVLPLPSKSAEQPEQ